MKNISKNQLIFTVLSIAFTSAFFYLLQNFITSETWNNVIITAFAFGILMFLNGLVNGYFEDERNLRINLSFSYHLITFITFNAVHLIYTFIYELLFLSSNAMFGAFFWSIGLIVHFLYVQKTIKGYTPEELFE
jgi:uncharacterized membrane protein